VTTITIDSEPYTCSANYIEWFKCVSHPFCWGWLSTCSTALLSS